MLWWLRMQLCKSEFKSQHPCKNQGIAAYTPVTVVQGDRDRRIFRAC